MTFLQRVDASDVKAGMTLHSIERYAGGTEIQFRGTVDYVFFAPDGRRCSQLVGVPLWNPEDRHPVRVDLFQVLDD